MQCLCGQLVSSISIIEVILHINFELGAFRQLKRVSEYCTQINSTTCLKTAHTSR
jgi:hypothetical protein